MDINCKMSNIETNVELRKRGEMTGSIYVQKKLSFMERVAEFGIGNECRIGECF